MYGNKPYSLSREREGDKERESTNSQRLSPEALQQHFQVREPTQGDWAGRKFGVTEVKRVFLEGNTAACAFERHVSRRQKST